MKAPGALLFVHTSAGEGFVAVARSGHVAVVVRQARARRLVFTAFRAGLARLGVGLEELRGVLVSRGPGSFTGIRVGIATVQGLAVARGLRVWICDSLEVEAAGFAGSSEPLAICHDARRGEVYAALYDVSGLRPRQLVAPFCAAPELAARLLQSALPAAAAPRMSGSGCGLLNRPDWREEPRPAVERLAAAVFALALQGAYEALEPRQVEPFYLRRPDVQQHHRHP